MKTTLIVVGRTVEQHYITAINDYIERTKHFISFDMEVIPELKNTKSLTPEQQKEKEGELIAKALQPGDVVVLLDEHGKEMRSVEFARWMEKKLVNVNKRLVFIIGGPYGFSQKVYDAAHEKISMSKMTFSHQMIRLIFVEQIYRAMTILNGGPYHIITSSSGQAISPPNAMGKKISESAVSPTTVDQMARAEKLRPPLATFILLMT